MYNVYIIGKRPAKKFMASHSFISYISDENDENDKDKEPHQFPKAIDILLYFKSSCQHLVTRRDSQTDRHMDPQTDENPVEI